MNLKAVGAGAAALLGTVLIGKVVLARRGKTATGPSTPEQPPQAEPAQAEPTVRSKDLRGAAIRLVEISQWWAQTKGKDLPGLRQRLQAFRDEFDVSLGTALAHAGQTDPALGDGQYRRRMFMTEGSKLQPSTAAPQSQDAPLEARGRSAKEMAAMFGLDGAPVPMQGRHYLRTWRPASVYRWEGIFGGEVVSPAQPWASCPPDGRPSPPEPRAIPKRAQTLPVPSRPYTRIAPQGGAVRLPPPKTPPIKLVQPGMMPQATQVLRPGQGRAQVQQAKVPAKSKAAWSRRLQQPGRPIVAADPRLKVAHPRRLTQPRHAGKIQSPTYIASPGMMPQATPRLLPGARRATPGAA